MTDTAGASIPDAAVAVRNTYTNVVINVTTNDTGYYEIRALNPGNYEVSVAATGFDKTVNTGIVLLANGFVLNSSCQPTSYNLSDFPRHVEGVRSQSLANWNANLGRTLNPGERFKVEARADFYNLFNRQRVAMIGGSQMNPTNSQFGQVSSDNG